MKKLVIIYLNDDYIIISNIVEEKHIFDGD